MVSRYCSLEHKDCSGSFTLSLILGVSLSSVVDAVGELILVVPTLQESFGKT